VKGEHRARGAAIAGDAQGGEAGGLRERHRYRPVFSFPRRGWEETARENQGLHADAGAVLRGTTRLAWGSISPHPFVIHYNLPGTLEAYVPRSGAGRADGAPSKGRLL